MQIQCMGLLKQLQDTVQICTLYIKVLQIFERFRSLWCFALLAAYFWVYVWGMTCMHATTQARFGMKMLLPHRGKFEYLLQQTIEVQNSRMNYFCSAPWRMKNKKNPNCWILLTWNHLESLGIWLIFRHWRRHIRRRNPWWGEWFSASSHPQNRSESVAWEKKHWMGRMGSMFMYFVVCSTCSTLLPNVDRNVTLPNTNSSEDLHLWRLHTVLGRDTFEIFCLHLWPSGLEPPCKQRDIKSPNPG